VKTCAELIALAEAVADANEPSAELGAAIDRAPRDGVLGIARAACVEARTTLRRPDHAGASARRAAAKAAALLVSTGGAGAGRRFLTALDDELRRLDIVHALALRGRTPSRPVARAIFRGADARGKVVVWVARLEGGAHGLLARQGRLWAWTEGSYDDVLATVPDVHFEAAAMAGRAGQADQAHRTT
jgi:hypothetical protein